MGSTYQAATAEGRQSFPCRKCKDMTQRLSRICAACQTKQRKQYAKDAMVMRGDSVADAVALLPPDRARTAWLWWSMHDELAVECVGAFSENKNSRSRLWKYGLKFHEWLEMVAVQKSRCAICQLVLHPLALNIDHDHGTGVVRGLLCTSCNTGLGLLGIDNGDVGADRAREVLNYAKRASELGRAVARTKNLKG